ncbi:(E3-independent) E2 ubiquitin-conjugating enzyme isoform X3 [Scyliorhinus torazame]|uniref:(E3-independent) E2 ubiquitin-conjugating enzyme isoform X3 n=1 Tax=Scyliorhinus torazame TaxID=75743 RepID=UPI003B5B1894
MEADTESDSGGGPATHSPGPGPPDTHSPGPGPPDTHSPGPGPPDTHSPGPGPPDTHSPGPGPPDTHSPGPGPPDTHSPGPGPPDTHSPGPGPPDTHSPGPGPPDTHSPGPGPPDTHSPGPGPPDTHSPGPGLPPSPAASPAPGSQRLLFVDDLVSGTYKGALRHGIVGLIHGEVSSGESSDTDEEGTGRERPLKKGYVRVQWYPEGGKQDVKETKLKLEDRSLMPRDLVRRMGKNTDNQCGTVIDVNMECTLKILGTNYILHPVNSRDLQHIWPFVYGDYIAFDCWLGKVDNIVAQLILKLSNGARCSMSTSDGSKLVDLCPHVSDSGQFFDESYGFYPGQMLFGAAKVFSNVHWLSGVRPVLSKKSKFKAVVEEVQVVELRVSWITKSFCLGGSESVYPPSPVITQENLPRIAVEILKTSTSVDVMWQDGTVEKDIRSNDLLPVHHVDNNEFCPGDFVLDKRAQGPQEVGVYGVVQSVDHIGRTCSVKWFKPKANGTEIEMLGHEEDISVYDIADHPDFHFRITDIVIRIGNVEEGRTMLKDNEEPSVGQVSRVDVSGKVEVVWADNSKSSILPQHLYNVESDIEESDLDSLDGTSTGATSDEWEDDSDSWETDDGVTEDEIVKGSEALEVGIEVAAQSEESKPEAEQAQAAGATSSGTSLEKVAKDGSPKGFHEIKEAIKILESLKNMTVEQLLTGSATSPTVEPEKQTKDKKFRDDIKKLQETLQKTLDNVAIVEEEKMEAVIETENKEEKLEVQTPTKSEWSSDTPVLCQQSSKPGVTFTSAKGEVFSVLESVPGLDLTALRTPLMLNARVSQNPESHAFKKMEFQPADSKRFFSTVRKEMALLATALPDGIMVKTFEDRMDLFSALIKGPTRTPYDDGLFLFDIQLPNVYPAVPPLFRYISQCSGRLNPNLYDNGKVCVSLLGTWIGKGTERWTSKSSLLQVLISIQGLILVNEPYYNEAGFDSDRGLQEGYENSRCYNEMALIKLVQSMTQLVQKPVEIFEQEIKEHFGTNGWRLVYRMESWLEINEMIQRSIELNNSADDEPIPISSDTTESQVEPLPPSAAQMVAESVQATKGLGVENSDDHVSDMQQRFLAEAGSDENICLETDSTEQLPTETCSLTLEQKGSSQAVVKPKRRRKSYRSFLPEKRGYPDIGFPLFPLSKGFVKSICGCLQQYKATLIESGIPERREER